VSKGKGLSIDGKRNLTVAVELKIICKRKISKRSGIAGRNYRTIG
jgi:hypothetical protein